MKHIPNAYAEGAPATPSPPPDIYDEVAYAYDGSLEGLLSAVFAAYERHERPTDVAPEERLQPRLGQRVALIRTLATGPDILLLDEAFSALDYQTRLNVTDDVYRILKREQVTTLMVTHDIPESISMGDKILVLSARPAQVKEILSVDFGPGRSPLSCRANRQFGPYFDHIWKELSTDEKS